MARMHSRRRGQSGSTKPRKPDTSWVVYEPSEVEQLVEKLGKQGMRPSQIGKELRDRYGVPDVRELTGDSIKDVLQDKDLAADIPEDLYNLMEKAVRIGEHLDENENDLEAKRNLKLTESKIRRLVRYYQGDEIPEDWTYSLETARLVVEG